MMFIEATQDAGVSFSAMAAKHGPSTTSSILCHSLASIKDSQAGDLFLVWNNHDGVPDCLKQAGRRSLSTAISRTTAKPEIDQNTEGTWTEDTTLHRNRLHRRRRDPGILRHARTSTPRITKSPIWLYAPEPKVNIEYEKSLCGNLKEGAFTKLGSDWDNGLRKKDTPKS